MENGPANRFHACDYVSPIGEHAHIRSQRFTTVDDEVHLGEKRFIWTLRIAAMEGGMTALIGLEADIENNRLNHRESLGCSIFQVVIRILAVKLVEKAPGRVPEIEKGRTIIVNEKSSVRAHLQPLQELNSLPDLGPPASRSNAPCSSTEFD